ncbi:MAG: ceramidase domain-containing protein [Verrucomicrobia bacterium]|nr:ceramidase domain-containing protein [Verrucomicrobiota bacterium]
MSEIPPTRDECGRTRLPIWIHGFAWGAILLVTLALAGLSRAGHDQSVWDGWRESRELRHPGYAERVYIDEVFRTHANTWSNLAFVLVGLYGIAIGWHDLCRPSQIGAGYLVQTPGLSLTFGLACCNLGAGSGLFHASLTRFGQQLDVASMYPPLLVLIAMNLGRWIPCLPLGGHRRGLPTWPIWIALVVVASVFLFLYKWSMSSLNVLSTLVAIVSLCAVLDRFRRRRKLDVRWLGWSGTALIAAVICRQLDIAGRFTGPDAWLQGHALWHLLTGLSLGCMYFYHRSEMTIPIGRAALEKKPNQLQI